MNRGDPLKVLHLISSSGFYGAERVVVELAKGLQRRGGRAVIAILVNNTDRSRDMVREAEENGIETRVIRCHGKFSIRVMRELRQLIRRGEIDIVHSHGYKSNFYSYAATGGAIPLVATNHNWLKYRWRLVAYSMIDKVLLRRFDRIVAVSEAIREEMAGAGIPQAKMSVIDNGVDVEDIVSTAVRGSGGIRRQVGDAARIIGTVCSLKEEKGLRFLLEAAFQVVRDVAGAKFVIVGDGPLRQELERQVASRGAAADVIFAGYRNDVYEVLAGFDVFVLPSLKEGLPMVLLEAMAARVPVIATRVGSIPRVLADGVNGLLVSPGSSEELESAIQRLLRDPAHAESMASNAFARVQEHFSSDAMFSRYHEIYEELAGQRA